MGIDIYFKSEKGKSLLIYLLGKCIIYYIRDQGKFNEKAFGSNFDIMRIRQFDYGYDRVFNEFYAKSYFK